MKLTNRRSASWKLQTPSAYVGLSKEDKEYLKKFNNESVYHRGLRSETSLHNTKELTKSCDDMDHSARRCVMNKGTLFIEEMVNEDGKAFDFGSNYNEEAEVTLYDLNLK